MNMERKNLLHYYIIKQKKKIFIQLIMKILLKKNLILYLKNNYNKINKKFNIKTFNLYLFNFLFLIDIILNKIT